MLTGQNVLFWIVTQLFTCSVWAFNTIPSQGVTTGGGSLSLWGITICGLVTLIWTMVWIADNWVS